MLIKRTLYGLLTFAIMFLAVLALWSFAGNSNNAVAETIEGGQAVGGQTHQTSSFAVKWIEGDRNALAESTSPQDVEMAYTKWVALEEEGTDMECEDHPNQKVVYVDVGDQVIWCYEGISIGTTKLYTHTLWDERFGIIFENYAQEFSQGSKFFMVSGAWPEEGGITETVTYDSYWEAHTTEGTAYREYSNATVKVLIRFRGYVYHGAVGINDTPLGDVTLQLYGWNEGEEMPETPLQEVTSAADGFFNILEGETLDYYRLLAVPPAGMVPTGALSETGTVESANTVDWQQPDRATVHDNNLFYFDVPTPTPTPTNTPTTTPTPTSTPTVTPTPTITPTNPPDIKPILWMPVMLK